MNNNPTGAGVWPGLLHGPSCPRQLPALPCPPQGSVPGAGGGSVPSPGARAAAATAAPVMMSGRFQLPKHGCESGAAFPPVFGWSGTSRDKAPALQAPCQRGCPRAGSAVPAFQGVSAPRWHCDLGLLWNIPEGIHPSAGCPQSHHISRPRARPCSSRSNLQMKKKTKNKQPGAGNGCVCPRRHRAQPHVSQGWPHGSGHRGHPAPVGARGRRARLPPGSSAAAASPPALGRCLWFPSVVPLFGGSRRAAGRARCGTGWNRMGRDGMRRAGTGAGATPRREGSWG